MKFAAAGSHTSSPEELDDAPCHLVWEIDGRGSTGSYNSKKNRTRRIKICWGHEDLLKYECYLVFVAPENQVKLPNSDAFAMSQSRKSTHFLGRAVDSSSGKQGLIKSWWDLCKKNHGPRCNNVVPENDPFHQVLSQSYFGVIDVIDNRLVSLPYHTENQTLKFARYVALSYVWGVPDPKNPPYITTRANIMDHRVISGLEKALQKLPQAIRDSIEVVQKLGIRYIWIDSLCIVQDSRRSWRHNARVMNLIYGNATVTICAADGDDANTGLLAMDPESSTDQLKAECAPGVHLMVSRPPEISVQQSKWNKRAWTFQERLLSKRCLIFVQGRVYFQCRSTGMSEDIYADGQGSGWSLDFVQAPLQMLRELRSRALWFYTNCVSLYSSRELTKAGDVLAAFGGVSSLMESNMMVPFAFGLPTSHLDFALLWQPASRTKLREVEKDGKQNNETEFPSWSWCGWMGAKIEYRREMVDGCLENVHEWLTNHTWICWHIRDGHGDLRPLWDRERAEEDRSTEARWRGYRGRWACPPPDVTQQSETETTTQSQPDLRIVRARPEVVININNNNDMGRDYEEHDSEDERPRSFLQRHRSPGPPSSVSVPMREGEAYIEERRNNERVIRERVPDRGLNKDDWAENMNEREREIEVYRDERQDDDRNNVHYGPPNFFDIFGRVIRPEISRRPRYEFTQTLPENPFRVLKTPGGYNADPDNEFPDQPVLQFWSWFTSLHVVRAEFSEDKIKIGDGLSRCDIADSIGDWCGSIIVDSEWLKNRERKGHTMCQFVALSEAKAFTEDECSVWTYYIPKERNESSWDLFYVLLVEYYPEKGLYQRVALGKVFKASFALEEEDEWKEIILG